VFHDIFSNFGFPERKSIVIAYKLQKAQLDSGDYEQRLKKKLKYVTSKDYLRAHQKKHAV